MFLRKHEYEESKADDFSYIFLSELNYLDAIFDSDSKNYHAWSHKIWLLERYQLWNDPKHLKWAEKMLYEDV